MRKQNSSKTEWPHEISLRDEMIRSQAEGERVRERLVGADELQPVRRNHAESREAAKDKLMDPRSGNQPGVASEDRSPTLERPRR